MVVISSCKTTGSTVLTVPSITDTIISENSQNERIPSSFDLPAWLDFSKFISDRYEKYTIGISDPNLEPSIAYQQAVIRAKLLASLLTESTISNCNEIYTHLNQQRQTVENSSKFTRFQVIKTRLTFKDTQFQFIDSATTHYGEKIVLLKVLYDSVSQPKMESIQGTIDVMLAEYNLRTKFQENRYFNCVYEFSTPTILEQTSYHLYKVDETSDIVSTYNNLVLHVEPDLYKYLLYDASQVPDYPVKTKLYAGLWEAVFESIVLQMVNLNALGEFALQTLQDDYKNEYGNMNQSIDQQIHTYIFSGIITHLFISENELTLQIEKTKP